MLELLDNLIHDHTLRTVTLGTAILGIVSGALGAFGVLRRQSLLGDAISHAALPGIALAFLFTGSKAPLVLMAGAALTGWLGTYLVLCIIGHTRLKEDSSLGIVLSVFFGFGLMVLTYLQKHANASQAGLDSFLFGQAATLMTADVIAMTVLGGIAILLLALFWKEFKIMTFDPEFGASLGFPRKTLDILLLSLLVLSIVIGLQAVGVVLMSAMVVIPPAAARQWTNRLGGMVILSSVIGAIAGISGALVSGSMAEMPTGPAVVLSMAVLMLVSLFLAPGRGVLWELLRRQRNRQRFRLEGLLCDLYSLAAQHDDDFSHSHSIAVLQTMRTHKEGVQRGLEVLAQKGFVEESGNNQWRLTSSGYKQARRLTQRGNP